MMQPVASQATSPQPPAVEPTTPAPESSAMTQSPPAGRLARWALRAAPFLAVTPLLGAAWFVNRFNPTDRIPDPTGPCLYHRLSGLNGLECGGTRMFYYLIHGDVVNAARHHLPTLIAVPFLGYLWLRWVLGTFGVNLPPLRLSRRTLIAYGVFYVLFTMVLRNIDWGPFGWFDIPNLDGTTSN